MTKPLEPPLDEGEGRDLAIVKSVVGFVPWVGSALAELVGLQDPLAKRKEAFYKDVCDAINELRRRYAVSSHDLWTNEAFVSCVVQAGQIALRNHQAEKRSALRNALVSVASPTQSEDEAFQFLRYIDELTVSHVRILRTIAENAAAFEHCQSFERAYEQYASGHGGLDRFTFRAYLKDMNARGLVYSDDLEDLSEFESGVLRIVASTADRKPVSATGLGRKFLDFISTDHS